MLYEIRSFVGSFFSDRLFDLEKGKKVVVNGVLMIALLSPVLFKLLHLIVDKIDQSKDELLTLYLFLTLLVAIWIIRVLFGYARWPLLKVIPANSYLVDPTKGYDNALIEYTAQEIVRWHEFQKFSNLNIEVYTCKNGFDNYTLDLMSDDYKILKMNRLIYHLSFEVKLELKNAPSNNTLQQAIEYFKRCDYKDWKLADMDKDIMCKFINNEIEAISEFYNPYNSEQQKCFSDLVKKYFAKELVHTPLMFKSAKFYIN